MDLDDDYFTPPPKSPLPAAIIASILTTIVVFFALRTLDGRGFFSTVAKEKTVAQPPAAVEVPSVVGMKPEQAREVLRPRGLLLSLVAEKDSAQYAVGMIAEQTPLPQSQVPKDTVIQAAISRGGLKQVAIAKLAGFKVEDAIRQLAAQGLVAGPQRVVAQDAVPPGIVVDTEPAAGVLAAPRTAVTLVVSTGAAAAAAAATAVAVTAVAKPLPKVTGMRLRAAREELEKQGFKSGRIRHASDGDRVSGVVLEQRPAADTPATFGTAIDLTVNE